MAQALLGGVTVLTGLHPATVSAHFLLSIAIVGGCAALVMRASDAGDGPPVLLVRREVRVLTWVLIATTAALTIVGTLVTGSGPYSGDAASENRYSFDPRVVSWLHADIVVLFLGLLVGLIVAMHVSDAPTAARKAALHLLYASVLQGVLGYVQYFTGEPVGLVLIHLALSTVVWAGALFLLRPQRTRS